MISCTLMSTKAVVKDSAVRPPARRRLRSHDAAPLVTNAKSTYSVSELPSQVLDTTVPPADCESAATVSDVGIASGINTQSPGASCITELAVDHCIEQGISAVRSGRHAGIA